MPTPAASKIFGTSSDVYGDLMWPSNITSGFDYLRIDIVSFVPNKMGVSTGSLYDSSLAAVSIPTPTLNTTSDTILAAGVTNAIVSTGTKTTQKNLGTIMLPIPEDLNYTDTPKWSDQEVGVLGKFGPQLAAAIQGDDSASITTSIQTLAGAGKVDIALKALGKFADPNAITQNINGKIANPYVEQIFNGLGLRSFDFSWKLVPRNKKEQDSIHRIIKTLRANALPGFSETFGGGTGNAVLDKDLDDNLVGTDPNKEDSVGKVKSTNRWLTVPNIYKLRWMSEGTDIESLPKIKPCVLKNIQVSYTPDNVWATHLKDGRSNPYPVAYNLNLSFGEVEIITGKDVMEGNY